MRAFRNGKVDVLVATDVAARGIDVEGITHVINYQCPEDEKTYLHRIGRTARAGAAGVAITLVDWDDLPRWGLINRTLDLGIPEPQETYSNSEHLFIDLGIQQGTGATLPGAQRTRAGLDAEEVEDLGETGRRGGPARPAGGRGGDREGRGGKRDGRGGDRPRRRRGRFGRARGRAPDPQPSRSASRGRRDRRRAAAAEAARPPRAATPHPARAAHPAVAVVAAAAAPALPAPRPRPPAS